MSSRHKEQSVIESRSFNLPVDNIDTDQIIPAQFLTTTERDGLGQYCFYGWRFSEDGSEKASNPLRRHERETQQVLVAGSNFGCGSSREHAPWALLDFGFRAVISSRFADIFRSNALKNGLLPVPLPAVEVERLLDMLRHGNAGEVTVDLEAETITFPDGGTVPFRIDAHRRRCLLEGLDDIAFTLTRAEAVTRFAAARAAAAPWSLPQQ